MRIARVLLPDGQTWLARIEGRTAVLLAPERGRPGGDVLRDALADGVDLAGAGEGEPDLAEVVLQAPVAAPSKMMAIGLNYAEHAREAGAAPPAAPVVFVKLPNTLAAPVSELAVRPQHARQLDWEAELAVVIGRRTSEASREEAAGAVLGYAVANDMTARDLQFADSQWIRGKNLDGSCPLGPWITTPDEARVEDGLSVRCLVNGRVVQDGTTRDMIVDVPGLISYLSSTMTLEPGDVLLTGTPAGVGHGRTPPRYLRDGDLVRTEIAGLGALEQTVRHR